MSTREHTTAIILVISIYLSSFAYAEKSVYVISSQDCSLVKSYLIEDNDVNYQSTSALMGAPEQEGEGSGVIALAAWPEKNLIFATEDGSPVITWSSTNALVNVGDFNTEVNTPFGLGGIAVDTKKEKIYVAQAGTRFLYVYKWNDISKSLEPNGVAIFTPPSLQMYGLALDEDSNTLYVTDGTNTIRDYNTITWNLAGSFNITVNGQSRRAVGIAVDPDRGYLYTGSFSDDGQYHSHLVRTSLSDYSSIETSGFESDKMVVGIAIDKETGLVYCTSRMDESSNGDFRVYDYYLNLQKKIDYGEGYGGSGPAGVAVGSLFVPPFVRNIDKEENYPTIQEAIDEAEANNILVASEGTYFENVDFGGKAVSW